ncbi:hypothetical protein [Helicobacter rodentium]|nr:hypothetical protein [Helicobacter rodentium]
MKLIIARTCPKQSIILHTRNFAMESFKKRNIIDCHECYAFSQ